MEKNIDILDETLQLVFSKEEITKLKNGDDFKSSIFDTIDFANFLLEIEYLFNIKTVNIEEMFNNNQLTIDKIIQIINNN